MSRRSLRPLVGDLRQLASVRRIVLDDGPERGVRALAFSTGGGLDFWVLSDRSLDIGPLWHNGIPVAWQSPTGFRSPALHDQEGDGGMGFNRSFSGFLATCGLDHMRQPKGPHPHHGRLPFTPARVLAHGEDWARDEPVLFCEGEVVQARYGAEALRLHRRIEAPVGGSTIRIEDRVENIGFAPSPQAMLYHINLGCPAVATGTEILLNGSRVFGPVRLPDPDDSHASECLPAGDAARAECRIQTPATGGDFVFSLAFETGSLPHLQYWHDLRPNVGVLAVEPCTSAKGPDGLGGPERELAPGECRLYSLEMRFEGALAAVSASA